MSFCQTQLVPQTSRKLRTHQMLTILMNGKKEVIQKHIKYLIKEEINKTTLYK